MAGIYHTWLWRGFSIQLQWKLSQWDIVLTDGVYSTVALEGLFIDMYGARWTSGEQAVCWGWGERLGLFVSCGRGEAEPCTLLGLSVALAGMSQQIQQHVLAEGLGLHFNSTNTLSSDRASAHRRGGPQHHVHLNMTSNRRTVQKMIVRSQSWLYY